MNQSTSRVFWFGLLNKLIATKALNVNVERRIPFSSSFYVIENITPVSASTEILILGLRLYKLHVSC